MKPAIRLPGGFTRRHKRWTASTNDDARQLAENGAPSHLVVVADQQTAGKGRLGRHWISPPGNLYASAILRPAISIRRSTELSLLAAVALADALCGLAEHDLPLQLKWPNDVLIGGAKVAGILLECGGGADGKAAWVVIGTGVNIKSAPREASYPVTSLVEAGLSPISPLDLLNVYLVELSNWLERWHSQGFPVIKEAWRARSPGFGRPVKICLEGLEISGLFVDLDAGGGIVLEQANGRRCTFAAGDVIYAPA